jgi:hypothetical protein
MKDEARDIMRSYLYRQVNKRGVQTVQPNWGVRRQIIVSQYRNRYRDSGESERRDNKLITIGTLAGRCQLPR